MNNEIIEEVREARAALSAEHGYDRQRIYEWAKVTTAVHKQTLRGATLPPKPLATKDQPSKLQTPRKNQLPLARTTD
jgi:hypothetical protein